MLCTRNRWVALALHIGLTGFSGAALVACDNDEGRQQYAAGVGPQVQVYTLDEQRLEEVCGTFTAYVDTYVDLDAIAYAACLPVALFGSVNSDLCEVNLDNCMATFPAPVAVNSAAAVDGCVEDLRSCSATVGEFEDCVNAKVDIAVGEYSCSGAGDSSYLNNLTSLVSVCTRIDALCDQVQQHAPGPI